MPRQTSTTRQRRAERTRRSILQAALELVVQQGLERLSLREVARQVDYSPAALYEYFPSKEALVTALQGEADRQLRAAMRRVTSDLPPADQLVQAGLECLRFARQNPRLHALLIPAFPPASPLPSSAARQAFQEILSAGGFRLAPELGVEGTAQALWALVYGLASLQMDQAEVILRWFASQLQKED